jgi:mevalonate kinase
MTGTLSFHAKGKILLTGEYLVLQGADALAVPLVPGQKMIIERGEKNGVLTWSASDTESNWFNGEFKIADFAIISATDREVAERLKKVLLAARKLNGSFPAGYDGIKVITLLEFNRKWGFGSSSTLTSLIAQWACIDPMLLHQFVSKGSGYDVACSIAEGPLLYSLKDGKPKISSVDFHPPFGHNMQLVYLDSKQNSDAEVEAFGRMGRVGFSDEIRRISEISNLLPEVMDQEVFIGLMMEHEAIMSGVLGRETIKSRLFPDYDGVVKSLGAWGGDFVLALSARGSEYTSAYFRSKSLGVVFPYAFLAGLPFEQEAIIYKSLSV